jgi:hypothetical protein
MIGRLRERFPLLTVLAIVAYLFGGLLVSYGVDVLWGSALADQERIPLKRALQPA